MKKFEPGKILVNKLWTRNTCIPAFLHNYTHFSLLTIHVGRPETLTDWKSKSVTYLPLTDMGTYLQTWVGAGDARASKNGIILNGTSLLVLLYKCYHCVSSSLSTNSWWSGQCGVKTILVSSSISHSDVSNKKNRKKIITI